MSVYLSRRDFLKGITVAGGLGALGLPLLSSAAAPADWKFGPPMPVASGELVAATVGDSMFVMGGLNDENHAARP